MRVIATDYLRGAMPLLWVLLFWGFKSRVFDDHEDLFCVGGRRVASVPPSPPAQIVYNQIASRRHSGPLSERQPLYYGLAMTMEQ